MLIAGLAATGSAAAMGGGGHGGTAGGGAGGHGGFGGGGLGGGGFGGGGLGGGHMGGGFGGFGGFGSHGREHLRLHNGRTEAFGGQFGNGGYRGYGYGAYGYGGYGFRRGYVVHEEFGYGQNGDGLSDYAPYGRPINGCDPTTPSRAHPGCGFGAPIR